ncbi:hypothetical protein ACOMHN_003069 [Nucella lapillus]
MPRLSSRENPEGVSISKKSAAKLTTSPGPDRKPALLKSAMKKKAKSKTRRADQEESPLKRKLSPGDSVSSGFYDTTPGMISNFSYIETPEDSNMHASGYSPCKKQRQTDTTMEMAVQRARGEPDGTDGSVRTPKGTPRRLADVAEDTGDSPVKENKENSTLAAQKKQCIKVPLKIAGKKLKSFKTSSAKNKVSTKVKKNFDRTLPDETMVPKKPKLSWKEKKRERKMVRNNYGLIQAAKGVWEDLRRQKLPEEKRKELCQEMYAKVQGKIKELAVVHDSARIIQCLAQYGGPEYRTAILEELKDHVAELSKNKYAKFIIRKLLKYGTKAQRGAIMTGFHGCVRKLIRHKEAADVVEYAYNDFATASQRLFLLEEFYGPAFAMFRNQTTQSLDDVLKEQPDKKDMIMNNLKESLLPLIDKQILSHSMVHKIFFDFFKYADSRLQKDMIEALRESLAHMLHTKEGTRTAMACIWGGSVKDRKMIVKHLKEHLLKVCKEEAGHMLLLAIFDCVDDTRLLQKAILDEIVKNIGELIEDSHGRKVLTYLLVRRDHAFFCPDVIRILQEGDTNPTSKKDPAVRAQELREYVSQPLLSYLTENAAELLSNSHTSLIIPVILAHAAGDTSAAVEALANVVVTTSGPAQAGESSSQERPLSLVEDSAAHITLKKILASDRELMHQGKEGLFSVALLEAAEASTYKSWIASNRGCFMLVMMLEVENAQVTQNLLTQLAPLKKYLKKMTFKGAEILLRKMTEEQGPKSKKPVEICL